MSGYLFIRILEACNAGCTMCTFAQSKDRFRLELSDHRRLLDRAAAQGTTVVRLTGGEPLMHRHIVDLVASIAERGMSPSLITNGWHLGRLLPRLTDAGLHQVIVSIDGATAATHDELRRLPGLFDRAIGALAGATEVLPRTRVNTVAGPANIRELPRLQELLTEIGVDQWELSSLKLERALDYGPSELAVLDEVVSFVYDDAVAAGRLVPMGKVWCGRTPEERRRYLETGVTPRPDHRCHVVEQVRYVDARTREVYPCSLLPHRPNARTVAAGGQGDVDPWSPDACAVADRYAEIGPSVCTGCSTSAAGFSNQLADGAEAPPWAF
jgi:cytosylglucuronate decarboxylase